MSLVDALLLDPHPLNVWIAYRADGLKGTGTLSDPFNGSSAEALDEVLNQLPTRTCVHLGPSPRNAQDEAIPFQTRGYAEGETGGWQPKAGMKLIGAGIDVTVLRLVDAPAAKHSFAIGHALNDGGSPAQPNLVDFFEVSDLTIDCNLAGQSNAGLACGAVRLMGSNVRVRRMKVTNWGTKDAALSCTVIALITADPASNAYETADSGIEECVAVSPAVSATAAGAKVTILHAGSASVAPQLAEAYGRGPFIRNCFVDCGTLVTPGPEYRALSMNWCRAGVVEGNQIHNVTCGGPYLEYQSARDLIVRDNFYRNVLKGPFLNLGAFFPEGGMEVTAIVPITGFPPGAPPQMEATTAETTAFPLMGGERIKVVAEPAEFGGVFRIKSVIPPSGQELYFRFRYEVPAVPSGTFEDGTWQKVFGVGRLIVEGNVIEMPADTSAIVGIHVHDQALDGQPPDHVCGDVIIRNNKIRYLDGLAEEDSTGSGIEVNGAKNLLVRENLVDVTPPNPLHNQRCGAVRYFNNRSFADAVPGVALIQGFNEDTDKKYDELETEAEDAFVLAFMGRK